MTYRKKNTCWLRWHKKGNDKNKNYHTVKTIPKSNFEIVEKDKIDTTNAQIHDHSLSWFGTCTSIESGGIKLDLWSQASLLS